jgi:hypothetical protein
MSISLGRGRGARVKLISKQCNVGRPVEAKQTSGINVAPKESVKPVAHGLQPDILTSVIRALKSGCVTLEQLMEISTFLIQNGAELELTHADIISELFASLHQFVHSPNILVPDIRSTRYVILRLLEIRSQGWTIVPSSEAYFKQQISHFTPGHYSMTANLPESSPPRNSEAQWGTAWGVQGGKRLPPLKRLPAGRRRVGYGRH